MDAYILISDMPEEIKNLVTSLHTVLRDRFGNALWYAPQDALHITLLDWLQPRPGLSYPFDATAMFGQVRSSYEKAFEGALVNEGPISLRFDSIKVFPAAIIITATDDGQYDRVRQSFGRQVTLHEETKPIPKNIIHSTISRFREELPLSLVHAALEGTVFDEPCIIDHFHLVHMTKNLMQEREIIRSFPLS